VRPAVQQPRSALMCARTRAGGVRKGLQAFLVKSPLEMTSVLQARRPPWAPAGRQSCCRTGCRARQQSIADALIDCKDGSYTAGGQTKSRGGETHMNRESSRSHAIFTITVEHARHSEGNSARPCCQRPCATCDRSPEGPSAAGQTHQLRTCNTGHIMHIQR
jgi:hypothetical protein